MGHGLTNEETRVLLRIGRSSGAFTSARLNAIDTVVAQRLIYPYEFAHNVWGAPDEFALTNRGIEAARELAR